MADLTSCYFCGTAEAAEEGPAVPPSFDPPAAAQQSVVLCPACREKLTAVLEPVFEGDAAPASTAATGTADPERGDSVFGAFDAATDATGADTPTESGADDVDRIPASERDSPEPEPEREPEPQRRADDSAPEAGEPPEQYYAVLRFLENREFPVAREEIERVVAGAYDLSEREVAEIVDVAVQRGVLAEADGRLARSRDRL